MSTKSGGIRNSRPSEMPIADRSTVAEMKEGNSCQAEGMPVSAANFDFPSGEYVPEKQSSTEYQFEHENISQIDAETQKLICARKSGLQLVVLIVLGFLCTFLVLQAVLHWHPEFPDPHLKAFVKRSETGAVIGGVVGGTVVLLIILSVCFYQMCR